MKILVLYLTSLDLRRVSPAATPWLAAALDRWPWAEMSCYPGNDLLPTLLTGAYPREHGVWGVRLGPPPPPRWTDRLPDLLTTTAQCVRHFATGEFDLAAVPPWRRRRFRITRSKFRRFRRPREVLYEIGGLPSILALAEPSRYHYRAETDPARDLLPEIGGGEYALDWLELYSLNHVQQWSMDRPAWIVAYYGVIDRFVEKLHAKCRDSGVTLVLLNDHGHEPVKGSIDLLARLKELGLRRDEFSWFLEVSMARFWFHSDRARERIGALLEETGHLRAFPHGHPELERIHLALPPDYGELLVFLDSGWIFFPHDFYQPVASVVQGLRDCKQRPRIYDGRQRSNCGYLPGGPSEKGLMMVLDEGWAASRRAMALIDAAPSLLALLGSNQPISMRGTPVFFRENPG